MKTNPSVLVVDDDRNVLEVIEARLSSAGFRALKAPGPKDAIQIVKKQNVDLMISDMKMPDMSGMDLFTEVRSMQPELPVIFLTAYGTIPDAVRAVKAGAIDYLPKPFDGRELINKLQKILEKQVRSGKGEPRLASTVPGLDEVRSPEMKRLYEIVNKVAASDVNVLILGESGVGKERIAHQLHNLGARCKKPFIVVDCASTPLSLLESELFGHVKGSFTHAIRDKKGLIEAANGGTLFLDEIGNISTEMQIRLLRFIEDRKIRRIGEVKEIPINCRIIAATNSDLKEDIADGRFREDLYYRLRVVTLKVPRLRERKEDIPLLSQYFVKAYCQKHGLPQLKIPEGTIDWLCEYPWPGNVREMKNALEAAVVLCTDGMIRPKDLHLTGLPKITPQVDIDENSFTLEDNERNAIVRALKQSGGVQKSAAKLLGISRRAIHYKIKKYDIDSAALRPNGN